MSSLLTGTIFTTTILVASIATAQAPPAPTPDPPRINADQRAFARFFQEEEARLARFGYCRQIIASLPTHTIKGDIVDAITGKPINGARVALHWENDGCSRSGVGVDQIYLTPSEKEAIAPVFPAQTSGADGQFTFANVPQGDIQLSAKLEGYMDPSRWRRPANSSVSSSYIGGVKDEVHLSLLHDSKIHGTIKDEKGSPLDGWAVSFVQVHVQNGKYIRTRGRDTLTKNGMFTLDAQAGGDFYLVASHPIPPKTGQPKQCDQLVLWPAPDTPIDPDSKSNVVTGNRDIPLLRHIDPNSDLDIKIVVPDPQPYRRLTFPATTQKDIDEQYRVTLRPAFVEDDFRVDVPQGRVSDIPEMLVPDGDYIVTKWDHMGYGVSKRIKIDGLGPSQVVFPSATRITVPIQLSVENLSEEESSAVLRAHNFDIWFQFEGEAEPGMHFAQFRATAKSRQVIALLPGSYRAGGWLSSNDLYVSSVTAGDIDLFNHPYVFDKPGSILPIQVKLRTDGGQITGTTAKEGNLVNAFVYPIPHVHSAMALVSHPTYQSGTFKLSMLPPGDYQLIASVDELEIPYDDPEAIKPWLLRGVPVTIKPNTTLNLNLEVEP